LNRIEHCPSKNRRNRPSYPVIGLAEAIRRISRIKDMDAGQPADGPTLAVALGSRAEGGNPETVISALKKFGLLESTGARQFQLSARALDICSLDASDPRRIKAIGEAALSPPLFAELYREFGTRLPPENSLQAKLIKRGFRPRSASDVVNSYRDTFKLLTEEAPTDLAQTVDAKAPLPLDSIFTTETPNQAVAQDETLPAPGFIANAALRAAVRPQTELVFKLSRNCDAQVTIYGDATQEGIAKLTALLELTKDTFPSEAEYVPPRAAMWRSGQFDQPVTVTGVQGEHDGRLYMKIAESGTAVPEDELEYQDSARWA
jgi:hypothetical protein